MMSNPLEFTEPHRLPPSKLGPKSPATTPLEFTEPHRLPPWKSGPKTSPTTPPRIHGTLSTTPPSKSGPKTSPTTPSYPLLEFTERYRLPPSKSGRKTPSTTPPRIHGCDGRHPPGFSEHPPGPKSWINAWQGCW